MKKETKREDGDFMGIGKIGRGLRELGEDVIHVGLGALATAEEKGGNLVNDLLEKGKNRDDRDETLIEKSLHRAADQFKGLGGRIERGVKGGTESVLNRVGIPTHDQLEDLIERVDKLNTKVDKLNA